MSNSFVRPNEAADKGKKLDAEKTLVEGLEVYRIRYAKADESFRMDDDGAGTLYIGTAPAGSLESDPVWKIKKILTIGSITSILWASGTLGYSNSWEGRTGLTYL